MTNLASQKKKKENDKTGNHNTTRVTGRRVCAVGLIRGSTLIPEVQLAGNCVMDFFFFMIKKTPHPGVIFWL